MKHLESTIMSYLRKRNYPIPDNEGEPPARRTRLRQKLQEAALQKCISIETGNSNVVAYCSVVSDALACDQQFSRLKNFIFSSPEPCRTELRQLLYPFFIHFYIELILGGHKTPAQKFHARYVVTISELTQDSIISFLPQVQHVEDVKKNSKLMSFRESKFSVSLSDSSLQYLLEYLRKDDNMLTLQVFNLHIQVKIVEGSECKLHLYSEVNEASKKLKSESQFSAREQQISVGSLHDCIKQVNNTAPCLPSACLYSVLFSQERLTSIAVSKDFSVLAAGFDDSAIRVWSLSAKQLQILPSITDISQIGLSCDSRDVMIDCPENIVDDTSKQAECNEHELTIAVKDSCTMHGHSGTVFDIKFTSDTSHMLSCSDDSTVRLWNASTMKNDVIYRGHNYPVWTVDISTLDTYFVTGGMDKTARLWTFDRTYPLRIFSGHTMDVDCVRFHPNSNYIATASSDHTIRLWSVQDAQMVRVFTGVRGTVHTLAFSVNGKYLSSAGEDRRVKVWDIASGKLVKEYRGHTDTVYSLCFNPDTSMLVSCGLDNVVRLWDVKKGTTKHDGPTPCDIISTFSTNSTIPLLLQYHYQHNYLLAAGGKASYIQS